MNQQLVAGGLDANFNPLVGGLEMLYTLQRKTLAPDAEHLGNEIGSQRIEDVLHARADQLAGVLTQQFLGGLVDMREAPVLIDDKKTVGNALDDVVASFRE